MRLMLFRETVRATYRQVRRLVVLVVGGTLLLLGLLMTVTPGPATLVIPAGLAILSLEFAWARRLLQKAREFVHKAPGEQERT